MTRSLTAESAQAILQQIISEGEAYGRSQQRKGQRVLVEFVSANPNSPITVGNARGGAIGDVLSNLLEAVGYEVCREYYVNDAVNSMQMRHLGKSIEARYLQALGQEAEFPEDGYKGEYVSHIAKQIVERHGDKHVTPPKAERARVFTQLAEREMLALQKADLEAFGIVFDNWYSERSLYGTKKVDKAIQTLKSGGYAFEEKGALWLKSTAFGDDKDHPLIRPNGQHTYIASDAAYHADKFDRGFDLLINVWGPQHEEYIARTKAAVTAMGYDSSKLDIIIYQTVRLFSGGELAMMSKRASDMILLSELIAEIGKDAARFFLLTCGADVPLDLDLEQAKRKSPENPLFSIQQAHSRTREILHNGGATTAEDADLPSLTRDSEIALAKKMADYPEVIRLAAETYQPSRLTAYCKDLSELFDAYDRDTDSITTAGTALVEACRIVLRNALTMLGVTAPERVTPSN